MVDGESSRGVVFLRAMRPETVADMVFFSIGKHSEKVTHIIYMLIKRVGEMTKDRRLTCAEGHKCKMGSIHF